MATKEFPSKYKFLSEPDDELICGICLEVAEEPWQHGECGRLLCKKCLDKLGKDKPCPYCRRTMPLFFSDNRGKRAIQNLRVKCNNIDKGCNWVGTIGTLGEHADKCDYASLPCPNKCIDDQKRIRFFLVKDLDQHVERECPNRAYSCKYCWHKGTYVIITQHHVKRCPERRVVCSQKGCGKTMKRQEMTKHVENECLYTTILCKYVNLGCKIKLMRKDMAEHEDDDKLHLHMAIDMTARLFDKNAKLSKSNTKLTRRISALEGEKPFTFKVYEDVDMFESPCFYTSLKGYCMYIRVYPARGDDIVKHVSMDIHLDPGEFDKELSWPFKADVTITLLNQLQDNNHYSKIITAECVTVEDYVQCPMFIPHHELYLNPFQMRQYLKDNALYFRVTVLEANNWLKCTYV